MVNIDKKGEADLSIFAVTPCAGVWIEMLRKETSWLPSYMKDYESDAQPFWIKNYLGEKVGNYTYIKRVLGYA